MSASPDPKFTPDALERLLRETPSAATPIDDAGFSDRVLRALPKQNSRQRDPYDYRGPLCIAGALLGLAIGVKKASLPSVEEITDVYTQATVLTTRASAWVMEPNQLITLGALGLAVGILWLLDEQPRGER